MNLMTYKRPEHITKESQTLKYTRVSGHETGCVNQINQFRESGPSQRYHTFDRVSVRGIQNTSKNRVFFSEIN